MSVSKRVFGCANTCLSECLYCHGDGSSSNLVNAFPSSSLPPFLPPFIPSQSLSHQVIAKLNATSVIPGLLHPLLEEREEEGEEEQERKLSASRLTKEGGMEGWRGERREGGKDKGGKRGKR